ncbi:MAG: hypothetical protein WCD57_19655 [Acidobacteriaceae bacterium]
MALSVNLAQINSAARGNSDLRETLTGIHLALQSLYAQTGTTPLTKVDATAAAFTPPPAASRLSVSGANGGFTVSITAAQSSNNAPIYQEISSSAVANFASGVTVYPISTNTSYVFPNPGAILYWRLRSSYNQQNWSSYTVQPGAVSSGLISSVAAGSNLSLNQSNYATVDSVAAGSTATVRVYGSGGVGTSWTSILGNGSKVIAAGTILNVAYAASGFVVWDGQKYQLKPQLAQTFPDTWVPVGKVSVIANASGLVLPVIHAVVTGGVIVAYQIINPGNGLTAAPALTITDSTGSGATATAVVVAGAVTQVTPGSAGSGYSGSPTVTASGGVSGGAAGGGGATGANGGRLYANV